MNIPPCNQTRLQNNLDLEFCWESQQNHQTQGQKHPVFTYLQVSQVNKSQEEAPVSESPLILPQTQI